MSKQVSFIHAADLHLDSPFKGLANVPEHIFQEILESTFKALDQLVTYAIEKQVDFVLLVGDLFDNDKQSLKAQIRLRRAFEELNKYNIKVYFSYGNHDFTQGNIYPITYPENVYIFPNEEVGHITYYKNKEPLANIYGFSYENRAVTEKKVNQYVVVDEHIPFQIAMLHGSVATNTEHDHYAPFQIGEMTKEPFDYWALGHIHKREVLKVNPAIIYPGNIQGRNRKETGEKGCYHVTLTDTDCHYSFVPLHALEFVSLTMDVSGSDEIHQLEQLIRKKLLESQNTNVSKLIDLSLVSNDEKLIQWKNEELLDDVIEIVNEALLQAKNWLYIFRYQVKQNKSSGMPSFEGEHFLGELTGLLKDKSIHSYIQELYQHKDARKFIDKLSEEEAEEIKREAYGMLTYGLLKN